MIKSENAAAALREKLQQGETHFVFKKKDGSRREAVGTLNFDLIPTEDTQFSPKSKGKSAKTKSLIMTLKRWRGGAARQKTSSK
jgi:hypothetical protein